HPRGSTVHGLVCHDAPSAALYTLSLHDALPISRLDGVELLPLPKRPATRAAVALFALRAGLGLLVRSPRRLLKLVRNLRRQVPADRKSTRLNSSHDQISYAVFCLKKKNDTDQEN